MCEVFFGSKSQKISVLFDIKSDKKCIVLFCVNSVKKLFNLNSNIIQLLLSKSCKLVNLLM